MESAARSGFLAADALLRGSGRQSQQLGDALAGHFSIPHVAKHTVPETTCELDTAGCRLVNHRV